MSDPKPSRKQRARVSSLRHLEGLKPHVHGQDWKKKQPYGRWRFSWRLPLAGGRLPSPEWLCQRLAELYRFFVPPILLVAGGVMIWRQTQGQGVPSWLWLLLLPLLLEVPKFLRALTDIRLLIKMVVHGIRQFFAAILYIFVMLIVLVRSR